MGVGLNGPVNEMPLSHQNKTTYASKMKVKVIILASRPTKAFMKVEVPEPRSVYRV